MNLTTSEEIGLFLLALVVGFLVARYIESVKTPAAVAAVENKVKDYADDELVKLVGTLTARLADTSGEVQIKADADAAITRKSQLLARVQATVAAAKTS